MDNIQLSKNIKEDILQKINSIRCLFTQRDGVQKKCMNDFLKNENMLNVELSLLNQTLNDASLNAMATLIDYYFIYCMLVIGADIEKIRKVQYRNVNKKLILKCCRFDKSIKENFSLRLYKEKFDLKIKEECNLPLDKINYDYWTCYLGDAVSSTLYEYGVEIPKRFLFNFDESDESFKIPKEILDFHECMLPFYCNPCNSSGVKYNVYLDINNCLKHNTIPYVIYKIENFEEPNETRIYEFFEIKNYKVVFLKEGFLKDIAEISFDELRENLSYKANQGNFEICSLEEEWEIGSVIGIDHKNGYIDKKGEILYFYLGTILIARTRDSIFVEC